MKTKYLRIGKSSVAVLLSFLMVVSTMLVGSLGTIDVSADSSVSSDGSAILFIDYRTNNTWWGNGSSNQFGYVFNSTSNTGGLSFKKTSISGVEYIELPEGDWTGIVLTRSSSSTFDWDNFYNRTKSMTLSSSDNCINNWQAYDSDPGTGFESSSNYSFSQFKELEPEAELNTDEGDSVAVGDGVEFNAALTGDNAKFYDVKSVVYSADNAEVNGNVITFDSAAGGTTATVTATITYNAKGFTNITDTVVATTTVNVESAANVTYEAGEATTVDEEGNTVTGVNNTFTLDGNVVTAEPADGYAVYGVSYTYVKSDDSTGTGDAKALGNNKFKISVPNDVKDGSVVTVNVRFGTMRTFTVTAYVDDNNRGSYGENYNVSVSDGTTTETTSSTVNQVKISVQEGSQVTLTVNDTKTSDDFIIDKWSLTGDYTLDSGSLVLSDRKSGSSSYSSHTITITPQGNVDASAFFKEDEGTAIDKWIIWGTNDAWDDNPSSNTWKYSARVNKTYDGNYYAFIDKSTFKFSVGTSYFFGLSNSNSVRGKINPPSTSVSVTADENFKPYLSEYTGSQNRSGYYYGKFGVKNASVQTLRIQVLNNLDASAFKLSASLTPIEDEEEESSTVSTVQVIAKDGTIRGSYTKYARMANTEVVSAERNGTTHSRNTDNNTLNNHSINISAFSGLAETVNVERGSKITFTTTITSDANLYEVRAFNVNGETVPVTSVNGNAYTGEYTIPSDNTSNKFIEITPVYFYKLDSNGQAKDKSGNTVDVITFYVENFDDNAKEAWGKPYDSNYNNDAATLSCYAWYNNDQGIDLLGADNVNKPALGGYPGQPMVYENGRYVMQVPASINGNPVKGITLNNYVWDYVHSYTLGAEGEGSSGDSKRETINCQTYDYDDFVKLSELIESDNNKYNNIVVFRFKYRTEMNPAPNYSAYNNRFYGNTPDADNNSNGQTLKDLSNYKNGWENYLDYYDNTIDLFNNILSDEDISKANGKTFKIVSDGYRDMYLGHFGVLWYVYDPNGKFIGCLPSSAMFYNYTEKLVNGKLPDSMPSDFVINAFPGLSGDAAYYWSVYKTLYNGGSIGNGSHDSALGIPAIITYETAIRAQDSNSNGHPKDPGLRNDGRWFYSKKNATINANIIIEFKTDANLDDTNYIEDTYDASNLTTASKPKGVVTGAQPVFTNDGASYKNKVVAENVTVNTDDTFKFEVPEKTSLGYVYDTTTGSATTTTQQYEFVGWYLKKDGVYSKINPTELAKLTGETEMISQATLVARYVPYSGDLLTITHDLYKDSAYKFSESPSAHNGNGTPGVSVEVKYSNGSTSTLTVFDETDHSVSIDKTTLKTILESDPNAKLVVKLDVTTEGNTDSKAVSLETIYRKSNNETQSETGKNNTVGYVAFADDNSSSSADAYGISTWASTSDTATESSVSGSTEKNYSVTYNCDIADLFTTDEYSTLKTNIVRFYSDLSSESDSINANIIIEFKTDANLDDTNYIEDTYDASDLTTASNPKGVVTGAQPVFTNEGTSYENKVVAENVTVNSDDTFKFEVPEKTSSGYVYDETTGSAATETQKYEFVGWYLKEDDTYSKINPNDVDKLTGETEMSSDATLVARYVPYSGDLITITHDLYLGSAYKFSESPSAHNGTGTPGVTVEVQYSNGTTGTLTVFDETDNSVSVDKTTLKNILENDPDAKLVVKLDVTTEGNTDSNAVSLETIYRKSNNETQSETGKNNTVGYVSFADDNSSSSADAYGISTWASTSDTATESSVSGSTEKNYSVIYNCDITDLFATNEYSTLKTNIVRFYSDLSSENGRIEVQFKYYDRSDDSVSHSMPETVDIYPTTINLTVSGAVNSKEALAKLIADAAEQKGVVSDTDGQNKYLAVNDIYSVIDEYYFWASQEQAEAGFAILKNHHNGDSAYGTGVTYHADCYGYISSDSNYMEEFRQDARFTESALTENWVTYYDNNGNVLSETEALANPTSVNKVVVWGFNTPKDYTISFNVPKGDSTDASKAVVLVADSADENHPEIVGFTTTTLEPFTGKYNERVGRTYDETNGVDDLSPYLKKVYGISGSTTGKIFKDDTAETDRNPGVPTVTYNDTKYNFDGWYDANGVKVSSDYTYANRITADTELTAGYRRADVSESKGITLTKNATEKYIEDVTGDERIRYVTQLNTYGCSDSDYNIKDIAIIYIKPYNGTSFTDSEIATIVENVKNNNAVQALLTNTDKRESIVSTISDTDSYNGVAYAYDVVITANDGTQYDADSYDPNSSNTAVTEIGTAQIALTNKNRVQFALDLTYDSVQTGNKNADIIVIAAMNYDGEYVASDNYIRYTAGN